MTDSLHNQDLPDQTQKSMPGCRRVAHELPRKLPFLLSMVFAISLLLPSCGGDTQDAPPGEHLESTSDTGEAVDRGDDPEADPQVLLSEEAFAEISPPENVASVESAGEASRASSQNANDILDELLSLDIGEDEDVGEAAEDLLRQLGDQGARAVLPIRDLLLDSRDSDDMPPLLRVALLDVLLGMNSPEVEPAALDLLTNDPAPFEIWRLGLYLELNQPGRHTDSIRQAAEQALITTDPQSFVPPEFFQILALVGNAETAIVLAEVPLEQQAFAGLALAALPDGGGVPTLESEARVFETGRDTLEGRLALQLLAQEAWRSPQAAAALINLAERESIPRDLWPYLLDLVSGNWALSLSKPPPELLVGSHTYYGTSGDQVIWRVAPDPAQIADGSEEQRLSLLDQLQPLAPPDLAWDP